MKEKKLAMPEFRADLHCHTNCSDGTNSPAEIVRMAVDQGLSGLSITDHDTVEAYEEAVPLAKELGILLLPGVEFSSELKNTSIHILAYAFSLKNIALRAFCKRHLERRQDRNREILEELRRHGMPISEWEVIKANPVVGHKTQHSPGRPHIAQAMVMKGYVQSIEEAFHKYLSEKGSCYVAGKPFTIEETLDVIHQAGGLSIIAHPHLIDRRAIRKILFELPFDGLEAYYAKFPIWEQLKWVEKANEKGWLITGGSDFHGERKSYITLGCSWVNQEYFDRLWLHYKRHLDI